MTGRSHLFIPGRTYKPIYSTLIIAFVCTVVMIFLYQSVYRAAKNNGQEVAVIKMERASFKSHKSIKALVTTFIILGTFILLWLPYFCIILTIVFNTELQAYHMKMFDIFICLILLNSVCHPVIYAIRIRHVRK